MRWALAAILVVHGLIHFMGPAKAFGWAELPQLQLPISRTMGLVWGMAGLLLLATAVLHVAGARGWWILALFAVALSQAVIIGSWSDARVGTLPNLLVLAAVLATFLFRAEGNGIGG